MNTMQNLMPTLRLLDDALRIPVEQLVSQYRGKPWRVSAAQDMRDYASHPAAILSDSAYAVFVKFNEAANGLEQFEVELAGLRLLTERAGVLTPTPLGIIAVEGGTLMVLEAVQAVEREARHWRDIGRTLARIHQVKGATFGLDRQGYYGPLFQDNRPMTNWVEFFVERRLYPRLMSAIDSRHMPTAAIRQVEQFIARVSELCGPDVAPTLLHGDAQQNNYISTEQGAYIVDPAVYYGHPEMDLAYVDYFQPVPDDVLIGYQEELPIDPGFYERKDLWRVYTHLAIVGVEGEAWLGSLMDAVRKYV